MLSCDGTLTLRSPLSKTRNRMISGTPHKSVFNVSCFLWILCLFIFYFFKKSQYIFLVLLCEFHHMKTHMSAAWSVSMVLVQSAWLSRVLGHIRLGAIHCP